MEEPEGKKQRLWTPTFVILTILMAVLFCVMVYYGLIFNLLWCVGLGLFYGITLAFSYYYDTRRKQSISLMYVIQAAVVFAIILIFVRLQGIFGPDPFGYDYLILAFSMLFAGGMFGIPAYRYSKFNPKPAPETKT